MMCVIVMELRDNLALNIKQLIQMTNWVFLHSQHIFSVCLCLLYYFSRIYNHSKNIFLCNSLLFNQVLTNALFKVTEQSTNIAVFKALFVLFILVLENPF